MRRRQNLRDRRNTCGNKNYSDNLDVHHLDTPPNKKSNKLNVPKSLREPSQTRLSAQEMMNVGELQHSLSPLANRKLIGTAIKDEKDVKPKIKKEQEIDFTVNTRRKNRKWPTDARLVHVDHTPCSIECMKTHKDDSDEDTVVNKNVKATYGQQSLNGVPPQGTTTNAPTNVTETNLHNENGLVSETTTLHGVPIKETMQRDPKTLDSKSECATMNLNGNELQGVSATSSAEVNESTATTNETTDIPADSPTINQNQSELHGVSSGTTASVLDYLTC